MSRLVARGALSLVALTLVATTAPAQTQLPGKPQTASLDSDAPPGAPPHWLPNEPWVMQHWLPYDERRLYRLLGVSRGDVWRLLRDDTRTLAQLAQRRGWEPRALADALVAPWKGRLRDAARLAVLQSRALRTLTQGHLAQHIFFHSLHQNAIPDNAPAIFGTASRTEFQRLRRSELSPLQICRLNGFSRAHAQENAERTLRAKAAEGVGGEAMPASQARILLRRQLRQVPRWLQQTRYNGPPPLKQPRTSIATASNYSNNAALSGDGRRIVYEAYEAKLPAAKTRGEIGLLARGLGPAPPTLVSAPDAGSMRRTPRSAYNPAVSTDGRWVAFESAEGNLNFAKRYGQMAIYVRDLRRGVTRLASHALTRAPRSAYNPTISGDGRWVAYESSESRRGRLEVWAQDLRRGRALRVATGAYEPALSPDGRRLAYTALRDGRSQVFVRDLRSGATTLASRGVTGEAYEPVLSRDGRYAAFTSTVARRARIYVRDLRRRTTTLVAPRPGDGLAADAAAFEPSIARAGRRIAFVARDAGRRPRVYVRDLRTRTTTLVSRRSGATGAPAQGDSTHPAISGDGRRVAFTSDAFDLSPAKCNSARGIFVRDLDRATTRLVSSADGANRYLGPTRGSSASTDMLVTLLCA
jgi:Tol biopolymer transport system component